MNGISIYVCIGSYAGFKKEISGSTFRIVLGWISFAIILKDLEKLIEKTLKNYLELKRENLRAKIKHEPSNKELE